MQTIRLCTASVFSTTLRVTSPRGPLGAAQSDLLSDEGRHASAACAEIERHGDRGRGGAGGERRLAFCKDRPSPAEGVHGMHVELRCQGPLITVQSGGTINSRLPCYMDAKA